MQSASSAQSQLAAQPGTPGNWSICAAAMDHARRRQRRSASHVASAAARDARLGQRFQLVANSFPTTSGRQAYRLGSPVTDYTGTFKNTPRYREPIAGLLSDPAGVG